MRATHLVILSSTARTLLPNVRICGITSVFNLAMFHMSIDVLHRSTDKSGLTNPQIPNSANHQPPRYPTSKFQKSHPPHFRKLPTQVTHKSQHPQSQAKQCNESGHKPHVELPESMFSELEDFFCFLVPLPSLRPAESEVRVRRPKDKDIECNVIRNAACVIN